MGIFLRALDCNNKRAKRREFDANRAERERGGGREEARHGRKKNKH